jgi:dienelactone hydrolase
VDLYIAAHPSRLVVPGDIEAIQKPGLWVCGGEDNRFPEQTISKVDEILTKNGISHEMKVYPHGQHGFAIRGNENDERVRQAKLDALNDCAAFLKQKLQ